MKKNSFDKIYKNVSHEQKEKLIRFRATHPVEHLSVAGADWEYITCGQGEEALLFLTGALGQGENAFQLIQAFQPEYRVVSPSYAPVTTMAQLVDGIVGILDSEKIRQAHVSGNSYGGMVAQCLVRLYPNRVDKLILSSTVVPKPELGKKIEKALIFLSLLPVGLIRTLFKLRFRKVLKGQEFWLAYIREILAAITKGDLIARYKVVADVAMNYIFSPEDLQDWPGSILILRGEDDPLVKAPEQEALKALYPKARVHIFHGAGHAFNPEKQASVVKDFLREG